MKLNLSLNLVSAAYLAGAASAAGFYQGSEWVKELTVANFKSIVLDSPYVSLVEFYAPWCGHCQHMKPEYIKAGKSTSGLVNVAAVNCDDEINKGLCAEYGVKSFPTVKLFKPPKRKIIKTKSGKKKRAVPSTEDYRGERSAGPMAMFAIGKINNRVTHLNNTDSADKFLAKQTGKAPYPKVVLFANKKSKSSGPTSGVPPVFKVLALDFPSPFAYVPSNLKESFNVYNHLLPNHGKNPMVKTTILLYPDAESDPVEYEGDLKKDPIVKFIQAHSGEAWQLKKRQLGGNSEGDGADDETFEGLEDEEVIPESTPESEVESDVESEPESEVESENTENDIKVEIEYLYEEGLDDDKAPKTAVREEL